MRYIYLCYVKPFKHVVWKKSSTNNTVRHFCAHATKTKWNRKKVIYLKVFTVQGENTSTQGKTECHKNLSNGASYEKDSAGKLLR